MPFRHAECLVVLLLVAGLLCCSLSTSYGASFAAAQPGRGTSHRVTPGSGTGGTSTSKGTSSVASETAAPRDLVPRFERRIDLMEGQSLIDVLDGVPWFDGVAKTGVVPTSEFP